MNRRKVIKTGLLLGLVGTVSATGIWLLNGYDINKLTIQQATSDLQRLYLLSKDNDDGWNLSQVFNHLAQSIEFSMTGYPLHKSDGFKNSIGQAAFQVFSIRGKMSHDLDEPIPGAAPLDATNKLQAFSRLLMALDEFRSYDKLLHDHFAYGKLNHQQYTLAHVMHINNHIETMMKLQ